MKFTVIYTSCLITLIFLPIKTLNSDIWSYNGHFLRTTTPLILIWIIFKIRV
jgi:uncharacterized integral membrane protein